MIHSSFVRRLAVITAALLPVSVGSVLAQDAGHAAAQAADKNSAAVPMTAQVAAPASSGAAVALELNKLETTEKGCRAVVVVNNQSDTAYQTLKLELVMFEGGVFTRRIAVDLAPIRPQKRSVKLFEIDGIACDKISELLINDVMDCKTDAGAVDTCLQRLSVSSLASTKLSK